MRANCIYIYVQIYNIYVEPCSFIMTDDDDASEEQTLALLGWKLRLLHSYNEMIGTLIITTPHTCSTNFNAHTHTHANALPPHQKHICIMCAERTRALEMRKMHIENNYMLKRTLYTYMVVVIHCVCVCVKRDFQFKN